MTNVPQNIRDLFAKVQAKKAEIAAAENGSYVTNGEFRFGSNTKLIDIKTERNPEVLREVLAFLLEKEAFVQKAADLLDMPKTPFKWFGATVEQWTSDLKVRLTQLQLTERRAELKKAEETLLKISPALLEELELEAIANLVG